MTRAALAVALLTSSACGRGHRASCDDLGGVWRGETGERWMILDSGGPAVEIYPLFPDAPAVPGVEVAPRVIDLGLRGTTEGSVVHRRYLQGSAVCDGQAPAHVTACGTDGLELVLGDPAPPLSFAPCVWGTQAPTQVVRWRPE